MLIWAEKSIIIITSDRQTGNAVSACIMSMIFYCRVENLFKQDRHKGGSLGCHCMMQRFNIFGSIDYNQTFFQLEGIVFLVFTKSVSIHPSPSGDSWILSSKPPTIPFGIVVCLFFDNPSQNSYILSF